MFRIEITSLKEFQLFVDIIKGKDLNEQEIAEITGEVTRDTKALEEAINKAQGEV